MLKVSQNKSLNENSLHSNWSCDELWSKLSFGKLFVELILEDPKSRIEKLDQNPLCCWLQVWMSIIQSSLKHEHGQPGHFKLTANDSLLEVVSYFASRLSEIWTSSNKSPTVTERQSRSICWVDKLSTWFSNKISSLQPVPTNCENLGKILSEQPSMALERAIYPRQTTIVHFVVSSMWRREQLGLRNLVKLSDKISSDISVNFPVWRWSEWRTWNYS